MTRLGPPLNPTKTRLCEARTDPFDFLGNSFGLHRIRQDGHRHITASPSDKSVQSLKDKVGAILEPDKLGRSGPPRQRWQIRATTCRLQGFLIRNGYPGTVPDAAADVEGHALVERVGVPPHELSFAVSPNGTVLKRPTDQEAGICLGIPQGKDPPAAWIQHAIAIVGPDQILAEPQ